MEYAAIIIPTLNRVSHLRKCVNSLKCNPEATYSDLYISVDFPPSEKYFDGYEEVKDYVKTIAGFSQVHLYFQEANLGPGFNRIFLTNEVKKNHSTFIYTEDDNEFSLNALAYINWALNTFKNDPSIYAVCCRSDYKLLVDGDYAKTHAYCPFGTAYWVNKYEECKEFLNDENLNHLMFSNEKMNYLTDTSQKMFCYLIGDLLREVPDMRGKTDNITHIDIWENIYCILNNKYNIMPTLPKTRNWGFDGSGVHSYDAGFGSDLAELLDKNDSWPEHPINNNSDNSVAAQEFKSFGKMPLRTMIRDHFVLFAYRHFSDSLFNQLKKVLTRNADHTRPFYYG